MQWWRHSPFERAVLVQTGAAQVCCCATACLPFAKSPTRVRATDNCGCENRTEMATVERRRLVPLHEEHLANGDGSTSLPDRKRRPRRSCSRAIPTWTPSTLTMSLSRHTNWLGTARIRFRSGMPRGRYAACEGELASGSGGRGEHKSSRKARCWLHVVEPNGRALGRGQTKTGAGLKLVNGMSAAMPVIAVSVIERRVMATPCVGAAKLGGGSARRISVVRRPDSLRAPFRPSANR
jgi:hypothetical protein